MARFGRSKSMTTVAAITVFFTIMFSATLAQTDNKIGYRPDMNAIPELYPEKYPGFGAEQAPHDVPIPLSFSWCQNHMCSPNIQQHLAAYTPLCFLHASIHMLNDRINHQIQLKGLGQPAVMLSRQDFLDYSHLGGFGDNPLVDGGEGVDVMEYARQQGIPDETCNPWQSDGKSHQRNDTSDRCRNCMMLYNDNLEHCWNIPNFTKYKVIDYNFVRGEKEMMNEIFHNGPIQCGVVVDDEMIYNYAGGVYNDYGRMANLVIDHDVLVTGWGETIQPGENGEDDVVHKWWLVKQSWGSNIVGANGFMLVNRGNNTMRIEERCLFANVDISELVDNLQGKNVGTMFGLITPGEKPKLKPDNWDSLPHDFGPDDAEEVAIVEQAKIDKWMDTNIYTHAAEERREKRNEDIVIGMKSSPQTKALEWIFSVTGMIVIGLILACISALWLYYSSSSTNDGYQPIPQLPQ